MRLHCNGYFNILIGTKNVEKVYDELCNIVNTSSSDSREPSILTYTSKCDNKSEKELVHEPIRTDNKQTRSNTPIKRNSLTLYDMLDRTLYDQRVRIFENNAYDQNMPIYCGNVEDARRSSRVWNYLLSEVDRYIYTDGILDIKVRKE